jgi:uncharacterized protein YecT (DUF1311 family)
MFCFRAFIASLAACAMLAVPDAEAYEFPPVDDEVAARVETCISGAVEQYSGGSDCIGIIFDACEGHAASTYSMSACFAQEHDFWRSMIDRTLGAVLEDYKASDRRSITEEPLWESLANAQTAWEAFAIAQCQFVYDEAGAGSIRYINASVCKRDLAAERAIFLRRLAASG